MIDKYEIRYVNGKKELILFLNLNYEFGGNSGKVKSFKQVIRDYIKKNKINFRGGIITFVVGGVMIGNVIFNNDQFTNYKPNNDDYAYVSSEILQVSDKKLEEIQEVHEKSNRDLNIGRQVVQNKKTVSNDNSKQKVESKEKIDENVIEVDDNTYVNLKMNDGTIVKIELEEYIVGVVGAEMPALFNVEALKAQAIIARTYAIKAISKGNTLRADESNQSYKTTNELKNMWGGNYSTYYNKVKQAVDNTEGKVLTYNGAYIEAVYHSTSNGQTESSVNVWGNYYPYLVSVPSKYDNLNVSFETSKEISYQDISNKLGLDINKETNIELDGRTSGNRVGRVIIGENKYTGIDFRNILGLRSADFDIEFTDTGIIFTTRGYGHGVGMSQYGANGMAKNGYNYEAILKHYYLGVSLSDIH